MSTCNTSISYGNVSTPQSTCKVDSCGNTSSSIVIPKPAPCNVSTLTMNPTFLMSFSTGINFGELLALPFRSVPFLISPPSAESNAVLLSQASSFVFRQGTALSRTLSSTLATTNPIPSTGFSSVLPTLLGVATGTAAVVQQYQFTYIAGRLKYDAPSFATFSVRINFYSAPISFSSALSYTLFGSIVVPLSATQVEYQIIGTTSTFLPIRLDSSVIAIAQLVSNAAPATTSATLANVEISLTAQLNLVN